MPPYTQAGRPFKVSTPLGEDVLLLTGFEGREALSRPFDFRIDVVSVNAQVSAAELLHKPVWITGTTSGGTRVLHGMVRKLVQLGKSHDLVSYQLHIVPSLWFLHLASDCRIFQNLSALDIVQQVFRENGVTNVSVRCVKAYPKREYCVQYRETHFEFVSRLLEEEGIFYFFEHSAEAHVLVLHDDASGAKPCPGGGKARMASQNAGVDDSEIVLDLHTSRVVRTGEVVLRDYDPLKPSTRLAATATDSKTGSQYDYPGEFDSRDEAERHARLRLEEHAARESEVRGVATCRFLASGYRFSLSDHYRRDLNASYTLTDVMHVMRHGDYRSDENSAPFSYLAEFAAIPSATHFRPPRITPAPVVHGTQTAVVVGPAGEEIYVDKFGRVKVQFHWDRIGTLNENSSCWVRVASTWAGKQWGFVQIPRIGQEVIVDFLEGDPDRPIIIGSVYNADQMPPHGLPANKTWSGVKSRSSLQGTADNHNEIRFEDSKGEERILIHAEKDKRVEVEHDRTEFVGNDETYEVTRDQSISIGHDQTVSVGHNRTESVGNDENISITGLRTETVGKDESITIGQQRTESVGTNETIDIGKNRSVSVGGTETLDVTKARTTQIGTDDSLTVVKNFVLDAGDSITLKTGDASISMRKDGTISIKGKDITITGSGKISVKATADVVIKGSKVLSN